MQELTYEEYREHGGTSDHDAFLLLRTDCEAELERQTFGRIDELDDKIMRCMVVIMDEVLADKENEGLTSYGNGFETFGFGDGQTVQGKQKRIREICLKYLPKELTYRGAKC